jgi:hypothetical protein
MAIRNIPDPGEIPFFDYDSKKPTYWQEYLSHYLLKDIEAGFTAGGQTGVNTISAEFDEIKPEIEGIKEEIDHIKDYLNGEFNDNFEEQIMRLTQIKLMLEDISWRVLRQSINVILSYGGNIEDVSLLPDVD